jgi:hypothetical protein
MQRLVSNTYLYLSIGGCNLILYYVNASFCSQLAVVDYTAKVIEGSVLVVTFHDTIIEYYL